METSQQDREFTKIFLSLREAKAEEQYYIELAKSCGFTYDSWFKERLVELSEQLDYQKKQNDLKTRRRPRTRYLATKWRRY